MIQHTTISHAPPITMGKYRVMRFTDDFPTYQEAAHYAIEQGLNWVRETTRVPTH